MNSQGQYFKVAVDAAKKAGLIFEKNFGKAKHVKIKNGDITNFVTEADLAIEKLIRATILNKFPNHKIIGEEFGQNDITEKDLFWIIDPIDGTTNFIHGVPFCCISIALWNNQGPLLSVVSNPSTNELFTAIKGKGARLNGKKIQVSTSNNIKNFFGAAGWGRDKSFGVKIVPFMIQSVSKVRVFGSTVLETSAVSKGVFDYYVNGRIYIWDIAAAALLVTEAGGKATDWQGKKITPLTKQIIASNGKIHKKLLDLVKKIPSA
jgi:fructose-1,6-bisphosphatase/inositol monophosphatase family enzyme